MKFQEKITSRVRIKRKKMFIYPYLNKNFEICQEFNFQNKRQYLKKPSYEFESLIKVTKAKINRNINSKMSKIFQFKKLTYF
jgi:hypothetical protein